MVGDRILRPSFLSDGRSQWSLAGKSKVPKGKRIKRVYKSEVTGKSHVSVTLIGDPGPMNGVKRVRSVSGSYFQVELMKPAANDCVFSWWIGDAQ